MAFTNPWSVMLPDDGDSAYSGAAQIRNLCVNIEERMEPIVGDAGSGWSDVGHTIGSIAYLSASTASTDMASYCFCTFSTTQSADFLVTISFMAYNGTALAENDTITARLDAATVGHISNVVLAINEIKHICIQRVAQGVAPGSHTANLRFGGGFFDAVDITGVMVSVSPVLTYAVL